jgi:hypothetical protein
MKKLALLFALAAATGCGGRTFRDDDNRKTVEVDEGTTFTVTLQRPINWKGEPSIQGSILQVTGRMRPTSGVVEFQIQAKGLGETEIQIPPDYTLRVRVVSGSDRPSMPVRPR